MPVLGRGGVLELEREPIDPVVVTAAALQPAVNAVTISNPHFWSGDRVLLVASRGLPLGGTSPDGYGLYTDGVWTNIKVPGSQGSREDPFYVANALEIDFYVTAAAAGLETSKEVFVHRDVLDRVSFYRSARQAVNGRSADRIPIENLDFGAMIVAPDGPAPYRQQLIALSDDLNDYAGAEQLLIDALDSQLVPPPVSQGFKLQAWLEEWSLRLSGNEVDATPLGEKFGDSVKALITGGGTLNCLLEHSYKRDEQDSTALMQLLFFLEKGCKSKAHFYMSKDRELGEVDQLGEPGYTYGGSIYYEAEIIITTSSVNTRADGVIALTCDFVTTGEIALRMGTD
jgi:hypothetical protein